MSFELTTERLLLVPLTSAHVQPIHALWSEPLVRQYLWDDEVITIERAAEPLRASAADFAAHGFRLWGMYVRTTGDLVGFCGLRRAELFSDPELLFAVADRWRRHGLAHEAARAVLRYARDECGLESVGAATDAANVDSQRLLERLGMRLVRRADHEGRDTLFYAKALAGT